MIKLKGTMIFICSLHYSTINKAFNTFLSTFQTVKHKIYFILITPNTNKCILKSVKLNINYNLCTLVTKSHVLENETTFAHELLTGEYKINNLCAFKEWSTLFFLHWEMKEHWSLVNHVKHEAFLSYLYATSVLSFPNANIKIVAAFRGMHVWPAKHRFGKCDRKVWQTDGRTDRRTDDGQSDPYVSLCLAGDTKMYFNPYISVKMTNNPLKPKKSMSILGHMTGVFHFKIYATVFLCFIAGEWHWSVNICS